MSQPVQRLDVLAVDDQPEVLGLVVDILTEEGLTVHATSEPNEAIEVVRQKRPTVAVLDLMMPKMNGLDLLDELLKVDGGLDVILLTGHYTPDLAVEAIKRGAADYLPKGTDISRVRDRVREIVDYRRENLKAQKLDREMVETFRFQGIVGRSPAVMEMLSAIRRIAPHFRTALVTGPTGSGKELVARALHNLSPRAKAPFVVANCGGFPDTLFESEMFGYVRGAFTGADQNKTGLFEAADGGAIFLDEIGDVPLPMQVKLLRVLQNQEIQKLGVPRTQKIDVRVVAATNRDLKQMVAEGTFREDLYYRLAMVEIPLPSLRQRAEDLPLLARHFIEQFAKMYNKPVQGLTRKAQLAMTRYSWPGNIRELENVLGRACMMTESELIDTADLPESLLHEASAPGASDGLISLDELQHRHAVRVLEHVGGNKARAAEILGITRTTLYRILARDEKNAEAAGAS